jgi:hypothetical protein
MGSIRILDDASKRWTFSSRRHSLGSKFQRNCEDPNPAYEWPINCTKAAGFTCLMDTTDCSS